ncbi:MULTISPECIES: hypothetical protein [unclassified Gordonia (in: high G+C Gram-positive bacteria)]|uniref:hypothetical protein n=1 Tax=unclassified Gordonia (in: high G+C Gram-positive bacteria) TaxID=2657482 RepID=UPI00111B3E2D|nr:MULTISPECIES: hypothetical protein [unclassified Gordonia (in: high G+C Gram-positive bacteria)]MDF3281113.1 hypothetical protein [Gordonia sp. N1V]
MPGYRRQWNLGAHSRRRPEYILTDENGSVWSGDVVFLGIEECDGCSTLGAVYWLDDVDLAILDHRELAYDRLLRTVVPVTPIDTIDRGRVDELSVHVYVPKPQAREHAAQVGASGVIMARYLRLVDSAFRSLGADLYAEHLGSLPPTAPFSVREISRRPAVAGPQA